MTPKKKFLKFFNLAEKKYKTSAKRLAGDAWQDPWQTLIATILSAQTGDEVTIPIAENLFAHYPSLNALANANQRNILQIIKGINYNKTKTYLIRGNSYEITFSYLKDKEAQFIVNGMKTDILKEGEYDSFFGNFAIRLAKIVDAEDVKQAQIYLGFKK